MLVFHYSDKSPGSQLQRIRPWSLGSMASGHVLEEHTRQNPRKEPGTRCMQPGQCWKTRFLQPGDPSSLFPASPKHLFSCESITE
jgi:hypothetical protein